MFTAQEAKHPATKRTVAMREESLAPSQYHAHRISNTNVIDPAHNGVASDVGRPRGIRRPCKTLKQGQATVTELQT
jgi:hypothetical protein